MFRALVLCVVSISLITVTSCQNTSMIKEKQNSAKVNLGIDNINDYMSVFDNKRVGLITNPTGVNSQLQSSADILKEKINLVLLFGPEHGIRGDAQAGKDVKSNLDKKTGLKVYSLYGPSGGFEPTTQMMSGIDILAYDIQDVGARFYTYISTMAYAMKACRKYNKTFVVFDRPNPISGDIVEGGMLKSGYQSFVGMLPVPVRYGLTCGELARYINHKLNINCNLYIIPMSGWKRSMFWNDTGLQWIMPSPNVPTPDAALAYSGTCFFEGTNVSEGRGTTQPFEIIGASWINPQELTDTLNMLNLPGVIFSPIYFTPTFSKFEGENCGGVNIHITNKAVYNSVETAVAMIKVMQRIYPDKFEFKAPSKGKWWIDLLTGSSLLRRSNYPYSKMNKIWDAESAKFKEQSASFYLYN
ncbi:MAG TPA: DUF1343 domain-containing protein [Victivallales bacterium]|nr:DUF1343 domain-containing protein [Victivallales bacterium]